MASIRAIGSSVAPETPERLKNNRTGSKSNERNVKNFDKVYRKAGVFILPFNERAIGGMHR